MKILNNIFFRLKKSDKNAIKKTPNLVAAMIGILYLISVVGFYIIARSFEDDGIKQSEWYGIAIFVMGLLGGLGLNAGLRTYLKIFKERN